MTFPMIDNGLLRELPTGAFVYNKTSTLVGILLGEGSLTISLGKYEGLS